jgi:aspartate racemase
VKTIGVLGGVGPQATMDFEARVHAVAQRLIPQAINSGYPPMVVWYFRDAPVIMPADGSFPTTRPPVNPQFVEAARRLGEWADFLIIASNGLHVFQAEIEQAAGRPVLSMVDVTLAEVRRRQLRRVGLMDFRTAEVGVYAEPLDRLGIAWEGLPPELLLRLTGVMIAVDEGRVGPGERETAAEALRYLRARGADGIIPTCTEFPFALGEHMDAPDVLNPVQLLAEAAVRAALG